MVKSLEQMASGTMLEDEKSMPSEAGCTGGLRVGVVGLGHGFVMAQQVLATRKAMLAGLCVKDPSKHAQKAEYLGAPVYNSIAALLDNARPDGVIVAASTDSLVEMAERCIERGVPVLLEKPGARDVTEIGRLQSAVKLRRTPVLVGYHRRFSNQIGWLKRAIDEKIVGSINRAVALWLVRKPDDYFGSWRVEPSAGGGMMMINIVHEIDTFQHLLGPICEVSAVGQETIRTRDELDHSCTITAKIENRMGGACHLTFIHSDLSPSPFSYENDAAENGVFHRYPKDCYLLFGATGTICFPSGEIWSTKRPGKGWTERLEHSIFADVTDNASCNPLLREVEHFLAVIEGQCNPAITLEDAASTLSVIQAIKDSMSLGRPVAPRACLAPTGTRSNGGGVLAGRRGKGG
ncbi:MULTISPECIES: Gfo/Idh/MocA family oxidoreductase [unclassified Bradyrhizobium]|uniref:Gfo/Idh/MocA family protein n=1 Tax=unclassified Bradyrhizobium TaxID=2631580 RepID=UPI0024793E17|nr:MULTISPECIES: Gfo/Idh/MocA family oxidoreductase [unclassified Bradyrhizobium]WGR97857.1 Gfo/Idh/MocA family oxidoreductase [Bradyrhizobium sp. ISRA436]WGS04747.1 Gfo/Idh/MocA family oxidoreductase [Bradyrhizobium sp. ISRA437]WGS11628.1 Gfo/Idh/MocA family oxidoreductase [Bradyrhizobium sp. ISRA443]WGS19111.1 Gfo/Idh/MocA family oxidoreductase [Bradyrhizobium sp. ISRA463]WGS25947.1 Gfo/Idh/MocA family oxidoreductase [Bradyrhizobium sp. ISRA464]